jgi:hypothetical protein
VVKLMREDRFPQIWVPNPENRVLRIATLCAWLELCDAPRMEANLADTFDLFSSIAVTARTTRWKVPKHFLIIIDFARLAGC